LQEHGDGLSLRQAMATVAKVAEAWNAERSQLR